MAFLITDQQIAAMASVLDQNERHLDVWIDGTHADSVWMKVITAGRRASKEYVINPKGETLELRVD